MATTGREQQATTLCSACDDVRRRQWKPHLVGKPCDICGGRGYDYLDRVCRHLPHTEKG